MYRKPRSTQRARHQAADGHLARSPKPHDPHRREGDPTVALKDDPVGLHTPPEFGDRMDHRNVKRLTNITIERTRNNANRLARRFTKFIEIMSGQVRIPRDVVGRQGTVIPGGVKCLDIREIPED